MRTGEELHPRGTAPGAPCMIVRKDARSRFLGPAFLAAGVTDLHRLAEATGQKVTAVPESLGGGQVYHEGQRERGPDFLGLTTGREPRRELRSVISAPRDDNEFTAERLPGLLKAANS
ncbi:MAG TPA: hypothetical protein VGD73_19750 [Pseudonocardia sp.]|uniref:hypothetical protein n=1 Tax=Pseudonocardia sp. TaxID=60912 RepID=UPI002ED7D391